MSNFLFSLLLLLLSSSLSGQSIKGYVLNSDSKTNYSVRFDTTNMKIQVGSYTEQIEYIIKDSISGQIAKNKKLFQSKSSIKLTIKSPKKNISKNARKLANKLTNQLKNKVFYLKKIGLNSYLIGTRFPQKKEFFKRYYLVYILEIKNKNLNILYKDIMRNKFKIDLYELDYFNKYIIVEKRRKLKIVRLANSS